MKYFLKLAGLGSFPIHDIDKHVFDEIKYARTVLNNSLEIEARFDLLISNYLELENELLTHAANAMVRSEYEYADAYRVQLSFNRRLVNLLSTSRMYVDHLNQFVIVKGLPREDAQSKFKQFLSREYDDKLEYRFMDQLRNHVQHRGLPVHWIQYNHSSENENHKSNRFVSMEMAFRKADLGDKHKFKKSVYKEIADVVDLKLSARVFVESLGKVHGKVRKLMKGTIEEAKSVYEKAIKSYNEIQPGGVLGLNAFHTKDDLVVDKIPIFLNWEDVRSKLADRNREVKGLGISFVTSRVSKKPLG